nr:hypothetical protein [Tanacetum cinerariifolium]
MSDSEDSIITYTAVSSPYGGLSDIGSLGVDGPPVMPEDPCAYVVAAFHAPPSPYYVPSPEYPPSLEFVPEMVYPEFMPAEDDILPAEEQPLPTATSPTAESPGYINEYDHEDDPKEDLADYPANGGEEGDDEDESSDDEEDESSDDDEDEDIDIEGDKEEDEYLDPDDTTAVALPAIDHATSAEETEPFETDKSAATPPPHPAYRVTTRMSIRTQTSISLPLDTKIARLMAIPTPQPPPLLLNTNGDDIHNSGTGARRTERITRECTYPDFMKCKPLNFKGTEGVVELTYALTWWNSYVTTVGPDAAYAMTWVDMKKKMTDKYCHKGEMKKLESELWNLRENLKDSIDIRMDIIHLEPVAAVAFPAVAVVRTQAQHGEAIQGIQEQLLGVPIQEKLTALKFRIDIAEAKNASLRVLRLSSSWLRFRIPNVRTERISGSSRSS